MNLAPFSTKFEFPASLECAVITCKNCAVHSDEANNDAQIWGTFSLVCLYKKFLISSLFDNNRSQKFYVKMATYRGSVGDLAKFEIPWEIPSSQFNAIPTTKLTKYSITAYNNVAFHWRMELSAATDNEKMCFSIYYDNGPLNATKSKCKMWVKELNGTYEDLMSSEGTAEFNRGCRLTADFVVGDRPFWTDPFFFRITLEIPVYYFRYAATYYFSRGQAIRRNLYHPPDWLKNQFTVLSDREQVVCSDTTLVSGDKKEFYCHRMVLAAQSAALEAMFRNASTEEEKKGIFPFPTVDEKALHAALEFFYMGDVMLKSTPLTEIVVLADFAEQYGLDALKEKCFFELWNQIVHQPIECIHLIRFADIHDDMKPLKERCFDVLAENYTELSLKSVDIFEMFTCGEDGDKNQDDRLRKEFYSYVDRRVEATFV